MDTVTVSVRLLCGIVGILLVVYLLAEITPKLAKFVDRLSDEEKTPPKEISPEEYTVSDIYEGDLNRKNTTDEKE